jgi:predicted dehydrogenase
VTRAPVRVCLVGHGLMGRAHSLAYAQAVTIDPSLEVRPERAVVCGRSEERAGAAADRFGFAEWSTDVAAAVSRDDIDLVDVCTSPGIHHEAVEAAAAAGKAVICEKPLGTSLDQALRSQKAVHDAGVQNAVSFNYRRLQSVSLMAELVKDGVIGEPRAARAIWLTDEFADPEIPFDWRFDRTTGGTVMGDLGVHLIDLVQWLVSPFVEVVASSATFVTERPDPEGGSPLPVRTDDSCGALGRLATGATVVLEMTRVALGRPCDWTLEITGSEGSIGFDYRNLNEIWLFTRQRAGRARGFERIRSELPGHPYSTRWWPQGQGIGYQESFTNQAIDWLHSWRRGPLTPDFDAGVSAQAVVEAIDSSAETGGWTRVARG